MKKIYFLMSWILLSSFFVQLKAQVDFREESIYFLMTTRFFDGDPSNNVPNEWCSYNGGVNEITDPNDVTWRGDFKGLIQKLDYIQDLGFTAIWITPIVQNAGPLDYHGYHAWDFTKVDPRLESPGATFQDLINEVHARGMKIVLDVVTNHSGRYGIKDVAELKYNTDPTQVWGQDKDGNPLQPNPNWEYDGMTPNPDDGKIWSRANLAKMPAPYNENLEAYNWPSTESFVYTSDENWFHHSGNGFAQGWDDTLNLYNRALAGDCPDLNTGSLDVRNYLIAAYTTFINMGVDALRWDTMKHMNKEDVLAFYDAFKAVNPDLFIFGETAQKRHELHTVEEINPHWYTWRGAVGSSEPSGIGQIDFYAEATFHGVFESGEGFSGVTAAARYDHLYSDPSTNLLWLDNHDFGPNNDWNRRYGGSAENLAAAMNFMFTWRGIPIVYYGTETQFKKGVYADIHEASDINRSLENTGRAYYGNEFESAPNHIIYQHIKKLNAIRKAVPALQGGDWRWDGNGGGNAVGYVRTKGTSIVAVGLAKDGDATFNFSGLQDGAYVDAVTGRAVSVSGGNLSFIVKSTSAGIYVFNGPGMIGENGAGFFEAGEGGPTKPVSSISPVPANYLNPIDVTISASLGSGAPYTIYYTTDGSEPNTGSSVYSSAINVSEDLSIKTLVKDKDGNMSLVSTYNYTIGEIEGLTVYMKNISNWGSVNVHYWNEVPDVLPTSTWPGPNMTDVGDGWFSYTFDGVTSTNLLFSNNSADKTGDMFRDKNGWYDDGTWYDTDPRTPVDNAPTVSISPAGGDFTLGESITVSVSATDDNDTPVVYYTTDGSTPSLSSALYSTSFNVSSSTTIKAIAYDSKNQVSTIASNSYTFSEPIQGLKVYMNNTSNWSSVNVHYWNEVPDVLPTSNWPGPNMMDEGDGWFSYTFDGVTSTNLLFSNNSADKTGDMFRDKTGWYGDGTWYDTDPRTPPVPQLSIDNPGTSFTTSISVSLSATENGVIYYTIDGSTPSESSTMYSGSLTFTETTTLNAQAFNSVGESNLITETYTKQTAPEGLTLHCKKPSDWSTVYIYFWNTTGASLSTGWPGQPMNDDGNGWYSYTLDGVECTSVIFNNNSSPQTSDYNNICQESWYDNGWVADPFKAGVLASNVDKNATVFKPYPNPFNNELSFSIGESNIDIRIHDLKGSVVFAKVLNSDNKNISIQPEISKGIYIMHITTNNKAYTYKIVKQ